MSQQELHRSTAGEAAPLGQQEEELLRLCSALLDDQPSEAELLRLAELLKDDAACRWYLDHVDAHARLLLQFEGEAESHPGDEPSEAQQPAPRAGRVLRRPAPLAVVTSALVCSLVLTAAAFIAAPIYWRHARNSQLAEEAAARTVARVTAVDKATWTAGECEVFEGTALETGDRILLNSGVAAIAFQSGAEIVLEGPVDLTLLGDNAALLAGGKLVARVPPRAKGFTVETAFAAIVDYGTQFGVEATLDGVDAHVFVGEVALQPTGLGSAKALRLAAGQQARADAGGISLTLSAADKSRFDMRRAFVNVARGKAIVDASPSWPAGQPNPVYVPFRAIDNRTSDVLGTFWVGRDATPDEYFTVDLKQVLRLDRIELVPTHNETKNDRGTKDFEIWAAVEIDANQQLVSPKLIASGMLPNAAGLGAEIPVYHVPEDPGTWHDVDARYVKFVARTYYGLGCGLNELRVFGDAAPAQPEP